MLTVGFGSGLKRSASQEEYDRYRREHICHVQLFLNGTINAFLLALEKHAAIADASTSLLRDVKQQGWSKDGGGLGDSRLNPAATGPSGSD